MALSSIVSTIEVEDSVGVKASYKLYLNGGGGLTTDELIADAGFVVSQYDTLSGAVIRRAYATIPLVLTGVKSAPVAPSNVQLGGLMKFYGVRPGYGLYIPAWLQSHVSGNECSLPSGFESVMTSTYWTIGGSGPFQSDDQGTSINTSRSTPYTIRKFCAALRRA